MKSTKIILCFLACFGFAYRVDSQATPASKPTVIAASTALDGRGGCCVGLRHDPRLGLSHRHTLRDGIAKVFSRPADSESRRGVEGDRKPCGVESLTTRKGAKRDEGIAAA
jgi:hypothetical protein